MLIRTKDPLELEPYLRTRISELMEMAVLKRQNLFPVPGWRSDRSCRIVRKGGRVTIARNSLLPEDFFLLEAQIGIPVLPKHILPAVHFKCGNHSEGILFIDGVPYSGIATGIWDGGAPVFLGGMAPGHHRLSIHIERDGGFGGFRGKERALFEKLDLLLVDTRLHEIALALELALDAYICLDENDPEKTQIRRGLIEIYDRIPLHDRKELGRHADCIIALLKAHIFNGKNRKDVCLGVFAHAHLDLAWLWSLEKTRRKSLRTFLTQLALTEKYPYMVFQQSQAPLYQWLKRDQPAVYARVRDAARRGRILAAGGMWVEADINITGLESLVRQLAYGKRFFKEAFGVDCRVLWLPDVFGFSRALPQLMKLAGLDLLITTKISWSRFTRFPHDTFRWFSPDGSEARVHFITAASSDRTTSHAYNNTPAAKTVWHTWGEYTNKEQNQTLLLPYGYGDGGGGAKDNMLLQVKWLTRGLRGFPRVENFGPEEFCRRLKRAVKTDCLPVWHDELYLERHRGTYTSQALIKKFNRQCEHLLKTVEKIEVLEKKAASKLRSQWEELMLLQFHDILPGTSVREVYEDAHGRLARMNGLLQKRLEGYLRAGSLRDPARAVVFNPHGWKFSGRIRLGDAHQYVADLPPLGKISMPLVQSPAQTLAGNVLENGLWRVTISRTSGAIARITDRRNGREILDGPGSLLEIYDDRGIIPHKEAWNLEYYHQLRPIGKGMAVQSCRFSGGIGWQKCLVKGRILHSPIQQTITLYDGAPVIYVDTEIDWREKEVVLKTANHLNILADRATYGIHGGAIERPVHKDRLEDHARFEVPAQGWMDLSEGAYGVSLLTDSKYGFSCQGGTARITLLRSPSSPDPTADRGLQRFSYGIYPHRGDWREAVTPVTAENFALPAAGLPGLACKAKIFLEVNDLDPSRADHFLVDVLKPAEDGRGIILRGHECQGSRGRVRVKINFADIRRARRCNLLEASLGELKLKDNHTLEFDYRPYEIITFRLSTR